MFILGLTGGIACGKSAVTTELKKYGATTFDIDAETRYLLQPGGAFYKAYLNHFGTANRKIIREIIFHDETERRWINSITHPILLDRLREFLIECMECGVELAVLEVPLLYEVGWENLFDEVWAMKIPRELQLQRLVRRDKITAAQAVARINVQMSVEEICKRADVVLENVGSYADLQAAIKLAVRGRWGSE